MFNNLEKVFVANSVRSIFIVFTLFMFLNNLSFATNYSPESVEQTMDYKSAASLISAIRNNKLDYLKNAKQLKKAFEESKIQNWEALHLESAALYAELLFRQEQYDKLNTHINKYQENEALHNQWDLYLLLLEVKLKYLSQEEDSTLAETLAKQLEEWLPSRPLKEKIIIFRALAYYYTNVDALKKTLTYALAGLELAKTDDDPAAQGFFLRKIGDAYNYLDEQEKALDYAKKAIEQYEKTQDELLTSKAYWSLGNALLDLGRPDDALAHLKKSLLYFESVNMQKGIAFGQYSIASIQFSQQKYDDAFATVTKNIALAKAAEVYDMQLASMILLSDIYNKQGRLEKANEVNDQVFAILDKFSRSVYKSNFLGARYKLKRQLGYIDEAFEAIEQELFYTKKHLKSTSESNIKTLQVQFEVKEKEDEILRLAHENDISEFKAKQEYQQKMIWRLSTAITLILVLATLFLFYRQVRQRQKYHAIALTDYLTSCPNRRGIMRMAEEHVHEKEVTIAIVDLDLFKKINDTLGHDIGDLVLIAFTKAAQKTLRENDKFGRYGGEEWLFILNTTNTSTIHNIFLRLSENFANYCIDIKAKNPSLNWDVTFSMGATISHSTSNKLDELIKHADKLLYQAKANGRNQVVMDEWQPVSE
jgi:diguanylate cyclase (GGDEF)-like protein